MRPWNLRIKRSHVLLAVVLALVVAWQVPVVHRIIEGVADRPSTADAATIATQRVAAEHGLQRSFAKARRQLDDSRALTLPVGKAEADAVTAKALEDLRTVRRSALNAVGQVLRVPAGQMEAYVNSTDAMLEAANFDTEPGTLLAPDLYTVVSRAGELSQQIADTATRALTQPRASAAPSGSPKVSPRP